MMVRQGGRIGTQAHEDVWSAFDDVLGRQALRVTEAAELPSETQQDSAMMRVAERYAADL